MSRVLFLGALMTASTLVGCSSDDPGDPNDPMPDLCTDPGPLLSQDVFFSGGAADQNFVYFGDSAGRVIRIRLSNGSPEIVVALGSTETVRAAALNGNVIFLATTRQGSEMIGGGGRILSVGAQGGAPIVLANGLSIISAIAVDGANVYWLDQGVLTGTGFPPQGRLQRVLRGGGPIETLASGLAVPQDLALDTAGIYFTADGRSVPPSPGGVFRVLKSGGAVERLTTVASARGVAVDGGSVYFTTLDQGGAVMRAPISGGAPNFIYATGLPSPTAATLLGPTLYFVGDSDGSGDVQLVAAGGGDPELVAQAVNTPLALTATGCGMVVSSHGEVRLLPPP